MNPIEITIRMPVQVTARELDTSNEFPREETAALFYGRIRIDDPALSGTPEHFAKALESEFTGLMHDMLCFFEAEFISEMTEKAFPTIVRQASDVRRATRDSTAAAL